MLEIFSFRMRINKDVVKTREKKKNKQPLSNFPLTFKAIFKQLSYQVESWVAYKKNTCIVQYCTESISACPFS